MLDKLKGTKSNGQQSFWIVKQAYIWIGIAVIAIGFVSRYAVSGERVKQNTKAIVSIKEDVSEVQMAIVKIDTQYTYIKESLDRMGRQPRRRNNR